MPLGLLRAADERLHLGQDPPGHAELVRKGEADRRPLRPQQQLLHLAPDALGRQVVERDAAAHGGGAFVHRQFEARGELQGAEHAERVVGEGRRVDQAQAPVRQVVASAHRVLVDVGQRIPGDGVDGEIAPPRGLGHRHRRIAGDGESPVSRSALRFAARQCDVDAADLVDRERLADDLDAAQLPEQRPQLGFRNAEDLDVEVLGRQAEQPVADEASDEQRASAALLHEPRDGDGRRQGIDGHGLIVIRRPHPARACGSCPPGIDHSSQHFAA